MSHLATGKIGENEGNEDTLSIKEWMQRNNMLLRDEIYAALNDEGINTIADLKECTLEDIEEFISLANQRDEFQGNKRMKLLEKRKLKKMYECVAASDPNKKHFVDPEEIKISNSIQLKIKKFENMIRNLESKDINIKQQKENIENDINKTFNVLISKLNDRKKELLHKLNGITQQKNEKIKIKMNKYEESFDKLNKIQTDTQALLHKAILMDEITARKLQITENEKSIDEIINKNAANDVPIGTKIIFTLDSTKTVEYLGALGVVLDADVPILQDVQYDNDNPEGIITVLWKLPDLEEKETEKRKLCVEYISSKDELKVDDEKKWNTEEFEVNQDLKGGTVCLMIAEIGVYVLRFKYLFRNNTLSSPYSNIKSVNVTQIIAPTIDSKIITSKEKIVLMKWLKIHVLKNDIQKRITLSLLYRMTRDGKDIKNAQTKYDGKGATITLIQPRDCDNVCGGYASVSWECKSHKLCTVDENAFIFLLRSRDGHKQQIFKPKDTQHAVNFHKLCGPSWGSASTLRVYPTAQYDAYASTDSVYNIPNTTLLGTPNCWLKDYEVYKLTIT